MGKVRRKHKRKTDYVVAIEISCGKPKYKLKTVLQ